MSYCPTCGTQMPANAINCTKCGVALNTDIENLNTTYGQRATTLRVLSIVGLASGIFIVLAGLIWFLQQFNLIPQTVQIWPFAAIIFGSLLLMGAVKGIRHLQ